MSSQSSSTNSTNSNIQFVDQETLYDIVMNDILPDIIKNNDLGEKLSDKLHIDLKDYCESDDRLSFVEYISTECCHPEFYNFNIPEFDVEEETFMVQSLIQGCCILSKFMGTESIHIPYSLVSRICKSYVYYTNTEKEFLKVHNTCFESLPNIYIKFVLEQMHPEFSITNAGMDKIKSLINPLISKFDLGEYNVKESRVKIVTKNIEKIKSFPEDLKNHVMSEMKRSVEREENQYIRHCIIEYLLAEILELSGDYTRNINNKIINPECIDQAISRDYGLYIFQYEIIR